jgi:GTP diphosphokinase / guanosine-3',5'-bis(diphosphate) 3'-diphosphatase
MSAQKAHLKESDALIQESGPAHHTPEGLSTLTDKSARKNGTRPALDTEANGAEPSHAVSDGIADGESAQANPLAPLKLTLAPTLDNLVKIAREYLPRSAVDDLRKAYRVADGAHQGQSRGTGDPYITHPVAVTIILAEMRLDLETLQAALLHDTVEDTPVTIDDIKRDFGDTVSHLVEGVTKLGAIPKLRPREESAADRDKHTEKIQREAAQQQAENLRKMFLAMFDDPRVVLIKLADRLHNMRTLGGVAGPKQQRIARETMDIYAPLANRLGMWQMKGELEDIAFSYLEPEKYAELTDALRESKAARDRYLKKVIATLDASLREAGIVASIKGRVKHGYSVYQKMLRKRRPAEFIYDVLAVRVMVDTVQECYAALGVIHSLWAPVPNEFDDYIGRPKESTYQSLHTAVWAHDNKPLEIQIRTHEMHEVAEYGIAAHWRYKEQRGARRDARYEEKIAWLRRMMSWRHDVESAQEFVDSLKSDVFQEHIYVFTPESDIIELPRGATPLDFAYRIHTDLGHQCGGAKINNRIAPLDSPLQNGDVVSIIKSTRRVGPSRDWLQSDRFLHTANARAKIRQYFRKLRRDENIAEGRAILEQTLRNLGLGHIAHTDVQAYFPRYSTLDDFLEAIGNTDISPQQLSSKLGEHRPDELMPPNGEAPTLTIPSNVTTGQFTSADGFLMNLGRCCKPMPGDEVIGYVTKGRGITIHRSDCMNLQSVSDTGRLQRVNWSGGKLTKFPAGVRIEALDRTGILHDLTALLAADKVNILSVHTHKEPGMASTTLFMTLEVSGVEQLYRVMDKLSAVRGIYTVQRDTGAPLNQQPN